MINIAESEMLIGYLFLGERPSVASKLGKGVMPWPLLKPVSREVMTEVYNNTKAPVHAAFSLHPTDSTLTRWR